MKCLLWKMKLLRHLGTKNLVMLQIYETNFLRMIKTHFRDGPDYKTSIQKRREVGRMGNPNVIQLQMTKNAFKLACLLARTEKSTQIYQFLLDLETNVTEFMKYEIEYLNEMANTKTTTMAIEPEHNTNDNIDLSGFPDLPVDSYDNTMVIYIFYLRCYHALKFGISSELHNRANRHYKTFGERAGDVLLVHVIKTEHASSIENSIKHACTQKDWKRDDIIINGSVQTEIIDLNKTSIHAVIQLMDSLLQKHLTLKRKHEDEIMEKNVRYIELKKQQLIFEGTKIELQIKKMEFELENRKLDMHQTQSLNVTEIDKLLHAYHIMNPSHHPFVYWSVIQHCTTDREGLKCALKSHIINKNMKWKNKPPTFQNIKHSTLNLNNSILNYMHS